MFSIFDYQNTPIEYSDPYIKYNDACWLLPLFNLAPEVRTFKRVEPMCDGKKLLHLFPVDGSFFFSFLFEPLGVSWLVNKCYIEMDKRGILDAVGGV